MPDHPKKTDEPTADDDVLMGGDAGSQKGAQRKGKSSKAELNTKPSIEEEEIVDEEAEEEEEEVVEEQNEEEEEVEVVPEPVKAVKKRKQRKE